MCGLLAHIQASTGVWAFSSCPGIDGCVGFWLVSRRRRVCGPLAHIHVSTLLCQSVVMAPTTKVIGLAVCQEESSGLLVHKFPGRRKL